MAKIGFNIIKDNFTPNQTQTKYFVWSDDGLKHPYNLIDFRFLDDKKNILFLGNLYDDIDNKSHEMAVQWCCNKLINDESYNDMQFYFEISVNGSWIRKF